MRKLLTLSVSLLLLLASVFVLGGCGSVGGSTGNYDTTDPTNPIATIEMEDGGVIAIELMPNYAPNTVNNFISLANSGFYDGIIFHRVIPDFMIQGGDPDGTGAGGPGYSIAGEFIDNGFDANVLSHTRGVISMARSGDPDSAGSQFFIVHGDSEFLDGQYTGFGAVIEGMDVVDKIANTPTAEDGMENSSPVDPPVIKTITIDTKGQAYPEPEKLPAM